MTWKICRNLFSGLPFLLVLLLRFELGISTTCFLLSSLGSSHLQSVSHKHRSTLGTASPSARDWKSECENIHPKSSWSLTLIHYFCRKHLSARLIHFFCQFLWAETPPMFSLFGCMCEKDYPCFSNILLWKKEDFT